MKAEAAAKKEEEVAASKDKDGPSTIYEEVLKLWSRSLILNAMNTSVQYVLQEDFGEEDLDDAYGEVAMDQSVRCRCWIIKLYLVADLHDNTVASFLAW